MSAEQVAIAEWNDVVRELEPIAAANKEIEPLGRGAWLLLGSGGLLFLANALRLADRQQLPYRVLLIEEAADWSPGVEKAD